MNRYIVGGALAGVALIVTLAASRAGRGAAPQAGRESADSSLVLGPADVATVARADLIEGVPVSGTLEPAVRVEITSPFPEVVTAVLVREGQAVGRGQVLARFRSASLEPVALSAEAQRRIAAADLERMRNLFREGAVAARDVENAEVVLRAAEAAGAQARERLADATVRSPVSGVVSRRGVESGDRVADGAFLFEVVNTHELEFAATVPSEHVRALRVGARAALAGPGLPPGGVGGRVARINVTADPATRQVKVYVSVPNREARLVAGLFASGRVVLRQVEDAVALPRAGVRSDGNGGSYALIVEHGKIARRDVSVGVVDEVAGLVEITAGLRGGETAVVGPAEGLQPGQAVTIAGREG